MTTSSTDPNLRPVTNGDLAAHEAREEGVVKRAFTTRAALVAIVASIVAPVGSGWVAHSYAQSGTAKAIAPVKADLQAADAAVIRRVERLEEGQQALQRQQVEKEGRDAQRFDALYRTILTRQPDPRAPELAKPMDGGPP